MMYILLILLLMALVGSSAAVVLLSVLERRRESPLATIALRYELLMVVVLLANITGFLMGIFDVVANPRIEFILMSVVNLSLLASAWWMIMGTALLTSVRVAGRGRTTYLFTCACIYVVSVYLSFFYDDRLSGFEFENATGFEISALFAAAVTLACTMYLYLWKKRIEPGIRRTVLSCATVFSSIAILSCANEQLHLASSLGLPGLPLSPVVLNVQNAIVLTFSMRVLIGKRKTVVSSFGGEPGFRDGKASAPEEAGFPTELTNDCLERVALKYSLSKREREVLPLLLSGINNERIGNQLFISIHTVKNHVHSIFQKTGVGSRFSLLRIAREVAAEK